MSLKDVFLKFAKILNPGLTPEQENQLGAELKDLDEKTERLVQPVPQTSPGPEPQKLGDELKDLFAEELKATREVNQQLREELAKANQAREAERAALEQRAAAEKQKNIETKIKEATEKGKIAPKDTEGIRRWTERLNKDYDAYATLLDEMPGNPALDKSTTGTPAGNAFVGVQSTQEKTIDALKAEAASVFETAKN